MSRNQTIEFVEKVLDHDYASCVFLEWFDQQGTTMRRGDGRVVKKLG